MNFKLFLENLNFEKTLEFTIRGADSQDFLTHLDYFPRQIAYQTDQKAVDFTHWMQDHMRVSPRGVIYLTVPVMLKYWRELGYLTSFLHQYYNDGQPYKRILHQVGPLLTRINIARVFLVSKLHKAPKEWHGTLYDALWNQPDANAWLTYADYIEERGEHEDALKIRNLFSK